MIRAAAERPRGAASALGLEYRRYVVVRRFT